MLREASAQFGQAERFGIAEFAARQRLARRFDDARGRGRSGLSHLHMDDICAPRLAFIGRAHHIHDDERIDAAARGERARQGFPFIRY